MLIKYIKFDITFDFLEIVFFLFIDRYLKCTSASPTFSLCSLHYRTSYNV